ncbi:UNVERIFIED_CONTAM: hypothetical protein NCL1_16958 [Trichonephila clavipes]
MKTEGEYFKDMTQCEKRIVLKNSELQNLRHPITCFYNEQNNMTEMHADKTIALFYRILGQQYFRVKPHDTSVIAGRTAELHCHVGNRAGLVQWSKDGFLLVVEDIKIEIKIVPIKDVSR